MVLPDLPDYLRAPLAFIVSLCAASALIPFVMRAAARLGAVDQPGDRRKHTASVPRLGGVAVVLATAFACVVIFALSGVGAGRLLTSQVVAVLLGGTLVFLVGLLDDVRGVPPFSKLLVQTIAAIVVVSADQSQAHLTFVEGLPGIALESAVPILGVIWIVGVTNAFNLVDGIDGLAVTCALVALGTMALSGVLLEQRSSFVLVMALLGALLAFLRKNWHPAKLFLGDAGSMTIGFVLAVRAIASATDKSGRVYALVPLAALAYPLLDTFVAIARRWLRGHSFSRADGRHIHHQLVTIGMSVPRAVSVIFSVAVCVAVSGLAISFAPPQFTVALVILFVLLAATVALYGIWRLGYNEFIAFGKSLYSMMSRSKRVVRERIRVADVAKLMKHAKDECELVALVDKLVDVEHIKWADLVDPRAARSDEIVEALNEPRLLRMEFYVRRGGLGHAFQLRVWATAEGIAHHSVQCMEVIIRPELELWYDKHSHGAIHPIHPVPAPRRLATPVGSDQLTA